MPATTPTATIELFRCARREMTLTRPGCARLFRSANAPEIPPRSHEGRALCVLCPVGAANAGVKVIPAAAARAAWATTCARCRRQAFRIINKTLCVSCYNRDAEARKGRNARGTRPALVDQLHAVEVAVIEGGKATERRCEMVLGLPEAMIRLAKAADGEVRFSRPPVQPGDLIGRLA